MTLSSLQMLAAVTMFYLGKETIKDVLNLEKNHQCPRTLSKCEDTHRAIAGWLCPELQTQGLNFQQCWGYLLMLLHHQKRQRRHNFSCLNDSNADDSNSVETHKRNMVLSTVSEWFVLLFSRVLWPLFPPPLYIPPHHTLLHLLFPVALIPSLCHILSYFPLPGTMVFPLPLLSHPSQLPKSGWATAFPPTPAAQGEDPRHRDGAILEDSSRALKAARHTEDAPGNPAKARAEHPETAPVRHSSWRCWLTVPSKRAVMFRVFRA